MNNGKEVLRRTLDFHLDFEKSAKSAIRQYGQDGELGPYAGMASLCGRRFMRLCLGAFCLIQKHVDEPRFNGAKLEQAPWFDPL